MICIFLFLRTSMDPEPVQTSVIVIAVVALDAEPNVMECWHVVSDGGKGKVLNCVLSLLGHMVHSREKQSTMKHDQMASKFTIYCTSFLHLITPVALETYHSKLPRCGGDVNGFITMKTYIKV